MPYNVAIIGAARRHQGTGPFIARIFSQLGHNLVGIVGTSEESTNQARVELASNYHIQTQAYTCFADLLSQHMLDIAVISSPPSTHLDYLQQALQHKCHVFCEKPLWWPNVAINELQQNDYVQVIEDVLTLARKNRSYIHLNTQWPYTLKDFIRLHPKAFPNQKINQFAMHLSPQSAGQSMLIDAASHGLSMLYHLLGPGSIENIQITQEGRSLLIDFDFTHASGCTKTTFGFIQSNETPKPASYQINGFNVDRIVALPEYQIQLQSTQQIMTIQDPLETSIKDFLACIDAQIETDESALRLGAVHLYQLIKHFITS